jgi:hypothetical protein
MPAKVQTVEDFHHDFPEDAKEMWDIVAKALLLRLNEGVIVITKEELRQAARSEAFIDPHQNGDLEFYIQKAQRDQH